MATNSRTTILLIEDSPSDTRLIKESLRDAPHEHFTVTTASTLAQGLRKLERDTIDAILLDLSLPDSDGVDTFHAVRKLKPSLPVVVLTMTDDDVLGLKMVHEGVQDYLPKTVLAQDTSTTALTHAIRYAIERKRFEAALAKSERKYRSLAESANVIILAVDPQLTITYCNDYTLRLLGYAQDEFIGQPLIGTLLPPTESTGRDLAQMARDILDYPERYEHNRNEVIRKDGTRLLIEWTNAPQYDADGTYLGILATGIDITEREQFKHISILNEVIHVINEAPDLPILYERALTTILEQLKFESGLIATITTAGALTVEYAYNQPPDFLKAIDGLKVNENPFTRGIYQQGEPVILETSLPGSVAYRLGWTGAMVGIPFLSEGKVIGHVSFHAADRRSFVADDRALFKTIGLEFGTAVARLKVKEALSESEARYRSLVERNFDGVIIHADGIIRYANDAAARIAKVSSPDELIGMSAFGISTPEYRELMKQRVQEIYRTHKSSDLIEIQMSAADGTIVDIELSGAFITYEGKPAIYVVARDISERKQMEAQLRNYAARAEEHARQQDILTRVITAGNKAADLQSALAAMLDTALDLLPLHYGGIFLRDGDAVALQHARGYNKEQLEWAQRIPLAQRIAALVMAGTPLFMDDYQGEISLEMRKINADVESMALIPLKAGAEMVGFYQLASRGHRHQFTDEEQMLLTAIGQEAGTVIARLQAEDAARTQARHTALLNKIIRRGNTTTDAQEFLQYVCDLLVTELGYDAADMRIITDVEDVGEQVAAAGYPAEFNEKFRFMPIDDPILRGVYGGKPYFPARYTKTHLALVHATHMGSHGIVPLAVGETIIGDMGIALKDYRPFSPDEQALLISIGRETGTVLERLQVEEAALQRASMLDSVQDAVIMRDMNDRITYWNHGAERLYGWTLDEALGKVVHDLLATTFPEPLEQIKSALLETGRWEGELIHQTKAGATVIVKSHKTLQRTSDGAPIATLEINTDITELKRYADHLEDLIEERTARLKDAERLAAIGQTATMIGHDLRNPLQALQLIVNLAEKYYDDLSPEQKAGFDAPTADRIFSSVEKQIHYMDKIVSDLQDYARPLTLEPEEVRLAAFITDTLGLLTIPESIRVNVRVTDSTTARIDPHLMQRALANLILNAVQAMPQGGGLTIDAAAEDHTAMITVHDTGEGVPENMKDTLFSPLTTGKAKGTGLGLAVVKRIVEAHNGTIEFESEEGKGTTFTIMLPKAGG